jgi:hypothetical protein
LLDAMNGIERETERPQQDAEGPGCLVRPGRPNLATARAQRGERLLDAMNGIERETERPQQDAEGRVAW